MEVVHGAQRVHGVEGIPVHTVVLHDHAVTSANKTHTVTLNVQDFIAFSLFSANIYPQIKTKNPLPRIPCFEPLN